jgi:hypothetical protein
MRRDGDKLYNKALLEKLEQRQLAIQDGKFAQICVFPEGFITNGSRLAPFKHGAFYSLLPVQPIVLLYSGFPEVPTTGSIDLRSSATYSLLCNLYCLQTRLILPPFIPNDYFFEKFAHKGT